MASKPGPILCSQCTKPAVVYVGDHPLCVDCNYKVKQTSWMEFAQAATMMNYAERDMGIAMGTPYSQIEIPRAPVPPIHYDNKSVTVTGGVVGSINFGNVEEISVDIDALTQTGEVAQAEALVKVTNAILDDNDLSSEQKNALLEQMAFLAKQAATPSQERKPGMIRSILGGIKEGAGAASSVATAWSSAEPLIRGYFGLT